MDTEITPMGNLKLMLDENGRRDLLETMLAGSNPGRFEQWLLEQLHERYVSVGPEEIGALTDGLILCAHDDYYWAEDEEGLNRINPDAKFYWHANYMVQNPFEELIIKGELVLISPK